MLENGKPLKQVVAERDSLEDHQQALELLREPERSCEDSNQAQTVSGNSCRGDATVTITGPPVGTDAERDFQGHSSWRPEGSALPFSRGIHCGTGFMESLLIQSLECGCLIEAKSISVSWPLGMLGKPAFGYCLVKIKTFPKYRKGV